MRPLPWLATVALAAALGLAAAGSPAGAAAGPAPPLDAPAPVGLSAAQVSPADRLLAARAAARQVSSYRMQGVAESARPGRTSILAEYVVPDRARLVMQGEADPSQPAPAVNALEVIVIGATAYLNFGAGWTKVEGDPGALAATSQFDPRALLDALDPAAVTLDGAEAVDGEPCDILAMVRDGETLRLWIAGSDDLVRKIEGAGGALTVSLVVTDLNAPIEIGAPI